MKNIVAEAHAVDVNCLLGRGTDRLWKFERAGELLRQMDEFYLERAVVSHSLAHDWNPADGNRLLLKEIAGRRRLRPCLTATPHLGTAEMPTARAYRAYLQKIRPAAVKLFPNSCNFKLHPFFAGELLALFNTLRLPVLLPWNECDPLTVAEASGAFPDIPFILLKAGFLQSRHLYPLLQKRANIHCSSSNFYDTNLLEEVVTRFGARRVLFGSDMPRLHPGPPLAVICYAAISAAEKKLILGGNWRRLEGGVRWA